MSTLLGAIAGGVLGLGQTALNAEIARRQSEADRAANYRYGEMAAENADRRTRLLYQDFHSPSALARQYEDAGLSKSLMFGGTPGQGGMSGAQGNGASGPQTPFAPANIVESALAMAQVDKIKAETRKANAEAANEEGTGPIGAATTAKLIQDAATAASQQGLNEMSTLLTETENNIRNVELEIQKATTQEQIQTIQANAKLANENATKAMYEAEKAGLDWKLALETFDDQKKIIEQQGQKLVQEVLALKVQNKYLDDKIYNEIRYVIKQTENLTWQEQYNEKSLNVDIINNIINQHLERMRQNLVAQELNLKDQGLSLEEWKTKIQAATEIFGSIVKGAFIGGGLKNQGTGGTRQPYNGPKGINADGSWK